MSRAARIEKYFLDHWYSNSDNAWGRVPRVLLSPLRSAFEAVAQHRLKNRVVANSEQKPIVVVIGNITIGGTGKTPLIIALATALIARGLRVGVVSRGYGGHFSRANKSDVKFVEVTDAADYVGDEPALIVQHMNKHVNYGSDFGLMIGADRSLAVKTLDEHMPVDIVLSDDGLQHYRMARHIELVVIDGHRGFGNGELLPKGPLREPLSRLSMADLALVNGALDNKTERILAKHDLSAVMFSSDNRFLRSLNPAADRMLASIDQRENVIDDSAACNINEMLAVIGCAHLVAGIGNPQRYFSAMKQKLGHANQECAVFEHAFPDHYRFAARDFHSVIGIADCEWDSTAILLTEKDAIKIAGLVGQLPVAVFAVSLEVDIDSSVVDLIAARVENSSS